MNAEQLLRSAAKKLNHTIIKNCTWNGSNFVEENGNIIEWNPLTRNSDTLQIISMLNLSVLIIKNVVNVFSSTGVFVASESAVDDDMPQAVRNVIVRVTSEIDIDTHALFYLDGSNTKSDDKSDVGFHKDWFDTANALVEKYGDECYANSERCEYIETKKEILQQFTIAKRAICLIERLEKGSYNDDLKHELDLFYEMLRSKRQLSS